MEGSEAKTMGGTVRITCTTGNLARTYSRPRGKGAGSSVPADGVGARVVAPAVEGSNAARDPRLGHSGRL
jgi:hypothetical protein